MSCVTTAARMSTKFPRTKPRYTLDNSFMQGTGTHTQVILNLKLPLSHGMDWTELASNICPQGMCLDHIRSRSQSRRSKLSAPRSIRDRAVNLQSAAATPLLNYGHHSFLHENPDFISRIKFLQINR